MIYPGDLPDNLFNSLNPVQNFVSRYVVMCGADTVSKYYFFGHENIEDATALCDSWMRKHRGHCAFTAAYDQSVGAIVHCTHEDGRVIDLRWIQEEIESEL